ncbi:MAG: ceramidase domain-containing protein [Pseudomonadota bacterium]
MAHDHKQAKFLKPSVVSAATIMIAVLLLILAPRIAQNPAYHNFADTRIIFSISNFWNVVSNIPFAVVGIYGLLKTARVSTDQRTSFIIFCWGVLLVALGSGYYHLTPSNATLMWDRLPMTIAFMALFAAILGDSLLPRCDPLLVTTLVLLGLTSVVYWYFTERSGAGDLRPYAMVQFFPMIVIAALLIQRGLRSFPNSTLWYALALYALAKVLEYFDTEVYAVLGQMSGHALKHLAAAAASWFVIVAYVTSAPSTKALSDTGHLDE